MSSVSVSTEIYAGVQKLTMHIFKANNKIFVIGWVSSIVKNIKVMHRGNKHEITYFRGAFISAALLKYGIYD